MKIRNIIRTNLKRSIVLFDYLTKWIPFPKIDILIISDFNGNQSALLEQFSDYKVKVIKYKTIKAYICAFYIRRAKVIYADNINIAIASLKDIDGLVVQYWHATSAIKRFGLPTVTDQAEFNERKAEFVKYDVVTVNSNYMADKFKLGFGIDDNKLSTVGCVQSQHMFQCPEIKPYFEYIVYVPTFRWNGKNDKKALEFIKNFHSDKYKLLYSLHPKVAEMIDNGDAIDISGTDVRRYFEHAKLVISDYSSLLIDASLKCSNVVMYAYDAVEYTDDPGLYIDKSNFWGFYTEKDCELFDYIDSDNYVEHDTNFIKSEFFTYDDSDSVKRVANLAKDYLQAAK
ncbi:CDP-glycerol glycerophosphotransferase family protein [Mollicutes bacterium LVI A0039]|nr:CDP-glycerol glycerophosphotransferase family protein [Mollicutes bacterium LVI A0039]